jgi:hypothetical protein
MANPILHIWQAVVFLQIIQLEIVPTHEGMHAVASELRTKLVAHVAQVEKVAQLRQSVIKHKSGVQVLFEASLYPI